MIISMIGSHGTGKTTLCNSLLTRLGSEWSVFDDYYRKTAQLLSDKTPREAVLENQSISQISSTAMAGAAFGACLSGLKALKAMTLLIHGLHHYLPIPLSAESMRHANQPVYAQAGQNHKSED